MKQVAPTPQTPGPPVAPTRQMASHGPGGGSEPGLVPGRWSAGDQRASFCAVLGRQRRSGPAKAHEAIKPPPDVGSGEISGPRNKWPRREPGMEEAATGLSAGAAASTGADRVLDLAGREPCRPLEAALSPALDPCATVQALAQEIVRSVSVQQVCGHTTVRLQLSTPRLARLDLELKLEAGRVAASFSLADAGEYRMLRAATAELEVALRARGLEVNPVQVDLRSGARTGRDDSPFSEPDWATQGNEPAPAHRRRAAGNTPSRRAISGTDYVA